MKSIHIFSAAFIGLFFLSAQLTAQVDMVWETHRVGFKVPRGFVVDTNTGEEFSAGNDNVYLTISPIQDENITTDDLVDLVDVMVKEMDYDLVTDGDAVNVQNFTGYYARGSKDGANAIVMALLDPSSATNLIVVVIYSGDFEDAALATVNSFFSY
ncbi:MAG: hypothetical protein K9J37_17510 [Saprospiraceae bacterium]|nr:hypothetical protein [Saprospiraceae bacterium]MCF8251715.1 hypothetical protein [Saprospiraceae bacterium]MCF8281097.1 hypothetical protein [Bacteroidales bacterium]MCF8311769.1 hypothetical protein [Saprospiraceae bacterium]MCF8441781.1 hypothetical protein [Saprospiraceae bacterium]